MVKQRQSQKQNVNVVVNLGEKKRKGKPKKRKTGKKSMRKETQIIPAFNPPSIINYPPMFNQQPNVYLNPPPPIPQKQYAVLPEGETAPVLNILPTVPVPLRLQTTEPEPNLAKAVKKTAEVQPFAPEIPEEPIFTSKTAEEPVPTFIEPAAEEFKAGELPEEPPSPTASTISGLTAEPPLGFLAPSLVNVFSQQALPPLKLASRLPLLGAEEILNPTSSLVPPPSTEFVFSEGLTGRSGLSEYSAPLSETKPLTQKQIDAKAKKAERQRLKRAETKAKKSLSNVEETQAEYEAQLSAFLTGEPTTFSLVPPEKIVSNPLERRRGASLTPAEESLLAQPNIPTMFSQRSV
jgi:hypothetical protein